MKSFQQFLSESIHIAGNFNGNLYMNSAPFEQQNESFLADIMWEGKIYRLEVEGKIMNKTELTEHIQTQYPGAIVHHVYPISPNSVNIKSSQRYRPESLTWSD